jgi:CBS domain-containing protein
MRAASIHNPIMDRVKDAMVADPPMLDGDASAQESGEALSRPEVRAVFVSDGGRLLGVVTRKTLVREVVAAGRDPRGTKLREIAEVPLNTIGSDLPLDEAFRFLEEHDLERVPVVEDGRLVGVLSRAVLQRRLAEDEPPPVDEG